MKPILFNTEMVKAILDGRKTVTRRITNISTEITCSFGNTTNHEFVPDNFTGGTPTGFVCRKCGFGVAPPYSRVPCGESLFRPRYWPGDILYVRETWQYAYDTDGNENIDYNSGRYLYAADNPTPFDGWIMPDGTMRDSMPWRPSIHMPKEAARIFLRVTDVRVERLQDITDEQAISEGIVRMFDHLSDAEYDEWSARTCPGKKKEDHGWNNYLWHGDFGNCGMGNKMSDAWPYQRSGYEEARLSFSSLWNLTVPLKDWPINGWDANPWVWVIEFERISKEEATP